MRARAQKKKKTAGGAKEKRPPRPPDVSAVAEVAPAAEAEPVVDVAPHRATPDPQQPPVVAPVLMPAVGLEVPAKELAVVVGAIAAGGVAGANAAGLAASATVATQLSTIQRQDATPAWHSDESPAQRSDAESAAAAPPRDEWAVGEDAAEDGEWRAGDEARLLVQSPRRLYLYWRFARDPRELMREALGPVAERMNPSVRLVDVASGEEGHPAPADGSDYWFDVLPGRLLRAEVGFHGEGLPFVRLISSNAVESPAAGVSRAEDEAPAFRVAAEEFGRVLEATGFAAEARREEPARPDAGGRADDPARPSDPARPGDLTRADEPPRARASSYAARPASSPRDGGHFSNTRGGELF